MPDLMEITLGIYRLRTRIRDLINNLDGLMLKMADFEREIVSRNGKETEPGEPYQWCRGPFGTYKEDSRSASKDKSKK